MLNLLGTLLAISFETPNTCVSSVLFRPLPIEAEEKESSNATLLTGKLSDIASLIPPSYDQFN